MKKIVAIFLLLIIITLSFGYAFLKISANGSSDNYFNINWRHKLARYYFMRQFIGLHYDGDAKSDYLGSGTDKILIEVDSMKGFYVDQEIVKEIANKIADVTGKETSFIFSDQDIAPSQVVTSDDLMEITKNNRNYRKDGNEAVLYLLLVSRKSSDPDRLGETLQEDGIVFFQQKLIEYSSGKEIEAYKNIILGTLFHEFGHQLGLLHNEQVGCLMNKKTEISTKMKREDVIIDFCDLERQEIKKLKTS